MKLDSPIEGSSSLSIIVTPSGIEPSEVNSLPLPAKAGSPTEVSLWLEGRESEIELRWLPRYSPELNPDEFLNNDLKQSLQNEPMPQNTPAFRDTIRRILERHGGKLTRAVLRGVRPLTAQEITS